MSYAKYMSPEYRELILSNFPALQTSEVYRKFFYFLRYGSLAWVDDEPSRMLHHKDIDKHANHPPSAVAFLEEFKREVLPELEWTDHSWDEGVARLVKGNPFPQWLLKAEQEENHRVVDNPSRKGTVDYITGEPYARKKAKGEKRAMSLIEMQKVITDVLDGIDYHNGLYKRITKPANWKAGTDAIRAITNEMVKEYCINVLDNTVIDPTLHYSRSEKGSIRLYAKGQNILSFPRDIRKAFFRGCYDVDLKHSQFAIFSALLDCEKCNEFIASGASIWTHLGVHGVPKPLMKKFLYSVLYGMGKKNLADYHPNAKELLKDPLVKELLKKREEFLQRIVKDEGVKCPIYGTFSPLEWETKKDPEVFKTNNARSLAATYMQTVEMLIISGVFEVYPALHKKKVRMMLFQHDGCTLSFGDTSHKASAEKLIKQAIKDKCTEVSILTGKQVMVDVEIEELT